MENDNRIKAMMKEPARYSALVEAANTHKVDLSAATKADVLELETLAIMQFPNNNGVKPEVY